MKKWLLAGCAALVLLYGDLMPFEGVDAGELCVVETLIVSAEGGNIALWSRDAEGTGEDFTKALELMEETAPGKLFLKQIKRVVFCQGAEEQVDVPELPREIPLGAAVYCSAHPPKKLLEDLDGLEKTMEVRENTGAEIPTLARVKNQGLREQEG